MGRRHQKSAFVRAQEEVQMVSGGLVHLRLVNNSNGKYILNYSENTHRAAYYTDSLDDAVIQAEYMAQHRQWR